MSWSYRTIIVTADQAPLARALAAQLSPAGEGMFATPLMPAGTTGPATHFISSGPIDHAFSPLLVDADALQAATGLPADVCWQLVDAADVTDPDVVPPFDRMAQLGLVLMPSEDDGGND